MYDFNVNPTVEYYHQSISINRNTHSQAIIGLSYFENYQAMPCIKELSHFSDIKNKWQSYSANDGAFFFLERSEEEKNALIKQFEKKFNMTSEEFKKLHATGKIPDAYEIMIWEGLLGLN